MARVIDQLPRTALIPVTTMEEIPVLSAKQRGELGASLAEAELEIAEGRGAPYDTEEARRRFMRGFDGRKQEPSPA